MKKKESTNSSFSKESSASFIEDHIPKKEEIQFTIGRYQVLKLIGKGGMGEIYLAYDPVCGRQIALKKVRSDLSDNRNLFNSFLREARITSQLTHPSIIPIYTIHSQKEMLFYTMPYVQGRTLKAVLKETRKQLREGRKLDHLGGSIPALIRVFLSVCQAVSYAHSKGVLHRDLKPENIIIGPFGEVLILDWGLAVLKKYEERKKLLNKKAAVGGTLSYLAPERVKGSHASEQTDLYSLGVILYEILALERPFIRKDLEEFKQNVDKERFLDPQVVTPHRDIPRILSRICEKALDVNLQNRYQSVQELIHDIESYIEGRSEWFLLSKLDPKNKKDWEFEANVLLAEHTAITNYAEEAQWVNLMISKESFQDNIRIEADITIDKKGKGIGILLCVPEFSERKSPLDGYCLWVGSENQKGANLLKSTIEVINSPDNFLSLEKKHHLVIEKIDNNIYFYVDKKLWFSYLSHTPLSGTHVGIFSKDAEFKISNFSIYSGSQNIFVNRLAVPDAFLAHKDYQKALTEYRRIANTFSGRKEGREAIFRAGVTLLEQAKATQDPLQKTQYFDLAYEEFEKLRKYHISAPLEYLGKSLIYYEQKDYKEEIKCFEIAFRRYPKHPTLSILKEKVIHRMHELTRSHRRAAYRFILFVLFHIPEIANTSSAKKLFENLQKSWEKLPFIQTPKKACNEQLAIGLGFWLAEPYLLLEVLDQIKDPILCDNALFCLLELGCENLAKRKAYKDSCFWQIYEEHPSSFQARYHLLEKALLKNDAPFIFHFLKDEKKLSSLEKPYLIWAFLLEKKWKKARSLLEEYSLETLMQETSILHFLFGCLLAATEGEKIALAHLSGVLESAHPRSWTLASHFLTGKIKEEGRWQKNAFLWEKRQLYKQLSLYYFCLDQKEKAKKYLSLANQMFIHAD